MRKNELQGLHSEPIDVQLRHNHLPKLVALELVAWDEEAGEIRRGDRYHTIQPLIELLENNHDELPIDWP